MKRRIGLLIMAALPSACGMAPSAPAPQVDEIGFGTALPLGRSPASVMCESKIWARWSKNLRRGAIGCSICNPAARGAQFLYHRFCG